MTHTLHRSGTKESLGGDFVFLFMPAFGINNVGSGPQLRRFLEIAQKHHPVNTGDAFYGNQFVKGFDNVLNNIRKDGAVVHAVFDNEEDAAAMLKDIKEADLGPSLVVPLRWAKLICVLLRKEPLFGRRKERHEVDG